MSRKPRIHAFIDGNNLHRGIIKQGWKLDYKRFRIYLKEKYGVDEAFYFIGLVPENEELYNSLMRWGYKLDFKPTLPMGEDQQVKGNCDVELTMKMMEGFYEKEYDGVVLVTSDGDFARLVRFLDERGVFRRLISANSKECSKLLKRTGVNITFLDARRLRGKIERRK